MNTFTENKDNPGQWDVIGPDLVGASEGDSVLVTKASGQTRSVVIGRPSRPFTGRFGDHKGVEVAIAPQLSSSRDSDRRGRDEANVKFHDFDEGVVFLTATEAEARFDADQGYML